MTVRDSIPQGSVILYERGYSIVYRVPAASPEPPPRPSNPMETAAPSQRRSEIWKVLFPEASAVEHERHRAEYLLLRRLQRLHWPTVRDFRYLNGGAQAIVMDEAPGVTFAELRFPAGFELPHLRICQQILAALDLLHWTQHAHADLKPENIFVDATDPESPRVTLIDLGLAIRFGERDRRGTLRDMPPEILYDNHPWSVASDHYLFGLVLFYLITGSFPRSTKDRSDDGWLDTILPMLPYNVPLGLTRLLRDLLGPVTGRPTRAAQIWSSLRDMIPEQAGGKERPLHEADTESKSGPPFPIVGRLQEVRSFETQIAPIESERGAKVVRCHVEGPAGSGRRTLIAHLGAIAETRGWVRSDAEDPNRLSFRTSESNAKLEFHSAIGLVTKQTRVAAPASGTERTERGSSAAVPAPAEERTERTSSAVPAPPAERTERTLSNAAAPPQSPAPSRPHLREVELRLQVQPLALSEMESLARTRLESPRLIERTARICLGIPGLLEAVLPTISLETDFVSRDFPGAWNEFEFEDRDPPAAFVTFAQAVGASLSSTLHGLYCVIAVVGTLWDRGALARLVGASTDSWMEGISPTAYPGLFDSDAESPTFSSPLWRSAWLGAHPGDCRESWKLLAPHFPPAASGDFLADACRTAIKLELWDEVSPLLDRALRKLHGLEMFTRELALLRFAFDRVPEEHLRISPARLNAIAQIIQLTPLAVGEALPSRFARGALPSGVKKDVRKVLMSAARFALKDKAGAFEALGPLETYRDGPPSLEWAVMYFIANSELPKEQLVQWLLRLTTLQRFCEPGIHTRLLLNVAESPAADEELRSRVVAEIDSLHDPESGWETGLLALVRSAILFTERRLDEALEEARRAEELLRRFEVRGRHHVALLRLSGISYEKGQLAEAYSYARAFFRQSLAAGLKKQSLLHLQNLVLCALVRGRFDLALIETEALKELSDNSVVSRRMIERAIALIALFSGVPELLPRQSDDDSSVEFALGAVYLMNGDRPRGRSILERVKHASAAEGHLDDVAETVLDWMQIEADLGDTDEALALWVELDTLFESLSPRARLKLLVAQNGMVMDNLIEPPANYESLLFSTLEALRRADYGVLLWRACWHLMELNRRQGHRALERRWRDEGRRHLHDLARGLPRLAWQTSFLQLPAQRRFLAIE